MKKSFYYYLFMLLLFAVMLTDSAKNVLGKVIRGSLGYYIGHSVATCFTLASGDKICSYSRVVPGSDVLIDLQRSCIGPSSALFSPNTVIGTTGEVVSVDVDGKRVPLNSSSDWECGGHADIRVP